MNKDKKDCKNDSCKNNTCCKTPMLDFIPEDRTVLYCKECNHKKEKVILKSSKSGKTSDMKCVNYLCKRYQNERL